MLTNVWFYLTGGKDLLVIRDTSERPRIVKSVHCGATRLNVSQTIWVEINPSKGPGTLFWKGISFDVSAFVEICSTCQKTNPCYEKEIGVLYSVNVPTKAMSQIGVDLSCLPPTPEGFRYVDYFTKWVEARPLKSQNCGRGNQFPVP